ncbi:MAG: hypothetical protein Q8O89_07165 [Nanoarchaeota archaeon]|nr:hypothetical protein [Nanoarchaeota archaeon]
MKTNSKKGYVRTVEVLIALFITILFLTIIIPRYYSSNTRVENLKIMDLLKEDESLRNCISGSDATCINTKIDAQLPDKYSFKYTLSSDQTVVAEGLPAKKVFVEAGYFAGNTTTYSPKTLRVYYWLR